MPPEPDNKIEELLKAYAKKRGAEAGAPFELHPATRQLLQSEVARLRPQAAARASWLELVIKFWPRLGFAASILAVLLGVVWMVNQGGDQTRQLAKSLPTSEPEFLANPNPLAKNPDRNEAARDRGAVSISEPPPASPAPGHRPAIQLSLQEARADSEAGKVEVSKGPSQLKLARSEESEKQLRADRKSGSELSRVTRSFSDEFGRKDQSPPAPATTAPEIFYRNLSEKKGAGTDSLNRGFAPGAAQPVSELPSSSVRVAGTTAASPASGNVQKEVGPSPSGAVGGFGGRKENRDFGVNAADDRVANRFSKMDADGATVKLEIASQKPPSRAPAGFGSGGGLGERLDDFSTAPQGGASNPASFAYALASSAPAQSQGVWLADQKIFQDSLGKADVYARSEKIAETDGSKPRPLKRNEGQVQQGLAMSGNVTSLAKSKAATEQQADSTKAPASAAVVDKTTALAAKIEPAHKPEVSRGDLFFSDPAGERDAISKWYFEARPVAAVTDRFRRINDPAKQILGELGGAALPVLSQFSLERQGDRLRIIDADGSVYEGRSVAAPAAADGAPGNRPGAVGGPLKSKIAALEDRLVPANSRQNNLSFQVSGTSRSLNQPVVLNGTLVSDPNPENPSATTNDFAENSLAEGLARPAAKPAPAPAPAAPRSFTERSRIERLGEKNGADAPATSPALPALRIQGKARVGDAKEIEINAVRVKP